MLGQDILDSRDIIKRIEELEAERDANGDFYDEDAEELKNLKEFEDAGVADWHHGETFILESYFEDYARQLAEDYGLLENSTSWPGRCIDWKQAIEELQQDYTVIEAGGYTYYARA